MDSAVWFYSIYPAFAALFCLLLSYKAYKTNAAFPYIKLFLNLAFINFFQMLIYAVIQSSFQLAGYFADIYLIGIYFLFAHFMQLALYLSEKNRVNWLKYLYIPPIVLTGMHIGGLMVHSYYLKGSAILHNNGEFAWMFDVFVLSASIITIATFAINYRQIKEDNLLQSKNMLALVSFIPFIVAASILIMLSNTDHHTPVVIVVPTISLYITLVFYYISRSVVIDLTIGPNAMFKRLQAAHMLLSTLKKKKDLDEFNRQLQLLRYKETMQRNKNNFNAAAEDLDVHPTTLRNALKEK